MFVQGERLLDGTQLVSDDRSVSDSEAEQVLEHRPLGSKHLDGGQPSSPFFFKTCEMPTLDIVLDGQDVCLEHDAFVPDSSRSPSSRMPRPFSSLASMFSTLPKAWQHRQLSFNISTRYYLHVARFCKLASLTPYQYFSKPPLAIAS